MLVRYFFQNFEITFNMVLESMREDFHVNDIVRLEVFGLKRYFSCCVEVESEVQKNGIFPRCRW